MNTHHTDQDERDSVRLCNCFLLVKELFPESGDKDALLIAAALAKRFFPPDQKTY